MTDFTLEPDELEPTRPAQPLTPETLAALLHEPALPVLRRCLRRLGQDRCAVLLAETLAVEAQGGCLQQDGQRRTPGGTFLRLAKTACTYAERGAIFYGQPLRPTRPAYVDRRPPISVVPLTELWLTWPTDLRKGGGRVKVVLTGRPKETLEQEDYVICQLESKAPENYPRGLPVPPAQGLVWTVLIARPQWLRVASALRRDREDILIIEGQPCQVETALFLYATNVLTKAQQRAKAAQQRHTALASS
jgi:PHAX RNA-binding domain